LENDATISLQVLFLQSQLMRLIRALLIYQHDRMQQLQMQVWHGTEHVIEQESLSLAEREFVRGYALLKRELCLDVQDIGLDSDGQDLVPPGELFLKVRVIKEGAGEIQTEFGTVRLDPGTQCYLRKTDVERWARLGYVAIV
jgi:hypothetical protein